MEQFTFKKEERLSSRKLIGQVMNVGSSFLVHPIRVSFMESELPSAYPAQVLVSASKRNFKKAVDRNRIKRLMREAYRKNKHILYDYLKNNQKQVAVMLIYIARDKPESKPLEDKIIVTLQRLVDELEAQKIKNNDRKI